ncbi:hypothetical protein [Allochromatium palmeri]|uniref:Uncharacterized protein n=1 Tax=Allochromatium palmeri TaxID=231048 RepID=A0A6N8EH69_9GAMM|nr:hypothetical protein [Allochromatium palmeri]MTW21664.1 hypothetical protein [Allochromatium palmeri]
MSGGLSGKTGLACHFEGKKSANIEALTEIKKNPRGPGCGASGEHAPVGVAGDWDRHPGGMMSDPVSLDNSDY